VSLAQNASFRLPETENTAGKKQERTNEKQMNDKPHCTAGTHKQCEQQFNTDNGHFVRVK